MKKHNLNNVSPCLSDDVILVNKVNSNVSFESTQHNSNHEKILIIITVCT